MFVTSLILIFYLYLSSYFKLALHAFDMKHAVQSQQSVMLSIAGTPIFLFELVIPTTYCDAQPAFFRHTRNYLHTISALYASSTKMTLNTDSKLVCSRAFFLFEEFLLRTFFLVSKRLKLFAHRYIIAFLDTSAREDGEISSFRSFYWLQASVQQRNVIKFFAHQNITTPDDHWQKYLQRSQHLGSYRLQKKRCKAIFRYHRRNLVHSAAV